MRPSPLASLVVMALSACAASGARPDAPPAPPANTRPARPLPPEPQAAAPAKGVESVYFSGDGTDVDEAGMHLLLAHAARLKGQPRLVVTLVAHTESLGSSSYKLAIAQEEIDAVTGLLRAFGVRGNQIRRRSGNAGKPAPSCATPPCRQELRRVDLIYE